MSKGPGNARYALGSSGRFSAPSADPHLLGNIQAMNNFSYHQHQQAHHSHPISGYQYQPLSNVPPHPNNIQVPSISNSNSDNPSKQHHYNIQMNYQPQRTNNVPSHLMYQMPSNHYYMTPHGMANIGQGSGTPYMLVFQPQNPNYAPRLPHSQHPIIPNTQSAQVQNNIPPQPVAPPQNMYNHSNHSNYNQHSQQQQQHHHQQQEQQQRQHHQQQQPPPQQQQPPQPPAQKPAPPQRTKKILAIIDPKTNKNILDDMDQPAPNPSIKDKGHGTNTQRLDMREPGPNMSMIPHKINNYMHHPRHPQNSHQPLFHQILQRPHNLTRPPSITPPSNTPPLPTHTPPPRPSSTPSPGRLNNTMGTPLVNDVTLESLCELNSDMKLGETHSEHSHIPQNLNSIKPREKHVPTVSALSTGPEVDLADLNHKALLSSKPATTQSSNLPIVQSHNSMKNKSKSNNGNMKSSESISNIACTTSPLPASNQSLTLSSSCSGSLSSLSTTNSIPPSSNVTPQETPKSSSHPSQNLAEQNKDFKEDKMSPKKENEHSYENKVVGEVENLKSEKELQSDLDSRSEVNEKSKFLPKEEYISIEAAAEIVEKHAAKLTESQMNSPKKSITSKETAIIEEKHTDPKVKVGESQTTPSSTGEQDGESNANTQETEDNAFLLEQANVVVNLVEYPTDNSLDPEKTTEEVIQNNSECVVSSSSEKAQEVAQPKIITLKYTYLPDQWSPINQSGMKKYSRDFLCDLQFEILSKRKPDNLPELDILKDISKTGYSNKNNYNTNVVQSRINDTFSPHYLNKSSGVVHRGVRPVLITKHRGSIQCKIQKPKPPKIVLSISLKNEVKLRETENAWKPNNITDEDDMLFKNVRGVLNKLTPENFEALVQRFKTFPINNKSRLDKVIDLVFQKAIAEPSFSEFYAKMCNEMLKMEVIDESKPLTTSGKHQSVNFKGLLLDKCQAEFEKNKTEERKADIKLEQIQSEEDPQKKIDLKLQLEEEERLIRKRSVGNCRFIGELFKLNMLTSKIMHYCISELLSKTEEEPLECACKLLATIGKDLDTEKDKGKIQEYFNIMTDLSSKRNSHKIPSRIRFMLQDVIDLRINRWIPRRNENKPKTIQQIQFEAESEKLGISLNPIKKIEDRKTQTELDRKKFQNAKDSGGWQQLKSVKNYTIDSKKLLSSREEGDLKLGPCSMLGSKAWIQGSNIKQSMPSIESVNRFAPFSTATPPPNIIRPYSNATNYNKPIDKVTPVFTNNGQSNNNGPPPTTPQTQLVNTNNLSNKVEALTLNNEILDNSAELEKNVNETLLEEKGKKFKISIEEYIFNKDFDELVKCKEVYSISDEEACLFIFEKGALNSTSEFHIKMGELIVKLNKEVGLEKQYICYAMTDYFNVSIEYDLYTDTPYLSKYLAEMIAPMLFDSVILFSDLKASSECLNNESGDYRLPLIKEVLKILGYFKSPAWVLKTWNECDVKLSDFASDSEELSRLYPFFFVTNMNNIDLTSINQNSFRTNRKPDSLRERIKEIIKSCDDKNIEGLSSDILNWTKGNFGLIKDLDLSYYGALTTVLCEVSIDEADKFSTDIFTNYLFIYKQFQLDEEKEQEILNSVFLLVQSLEFPKGFLLDIFQCLHSESVISTNGFIKWSESDQKGGKGVALKQLTSFFAMLNEDDLEDDFEDA